MIVKMNIFLQEWTERMPIIFKLKLSIAMGLVKEVKLKKLNKFWF